jgi:hypothetical protein
MLDIHLILCYNNSTKRKGDNKTMMKFEMTQHAKVDRIDRLVKCIELLGVGEVILTASNEEDTRRGIKRQLTSTGLVLIVSLESNILITGYMGNLSQVNAIYYDNGIEKMPVSMRKQVKKNVEKYKFLLEM